MPERLLPRLQFRLMQAADLPRVAALEKLCYPQPWPEDRFRSELANPRAQIELAECRGELVGYLVSWRVFDELEVQNLATAPSRRRSGIGRQLLQRLRDRALESGGSRLLLEVRAGNRAAIALYRNFGFQVDGCRKGYYADGEDALLLSLELPVASAE